MMDTCLVNWKLENDGQYNNKSEYFLMADGRKKDMETGISKWHVC